MSPPLPDRTISERVGSSAGAPKILIVEDDPKQALQLRRKLGDRNFQLGKMDCEIDFAEDIVTAREFLHEDSIDVYIIDLIMAENASATGESAAVGKDFVREVVAKSNAGIIVYSSLHADTEAAGLLHEGADDYLEKHENSETLSARVLALWRRILHVRPKSINLFAHSNRVFLIGGWRFTVGDRELQSTSGDRLRLSPTEHAFLRYICTIENHVLDIETFNVVVLGRPTYEREKRIDNFIYRVRNKLGKSVELSAQGSGAYKLINVRELKPKLK
jgi:two-component system response regulator CpxR